MKVLTFAFCAVVLLSMAGCSMINDKEVPCPEPTLAQIRFTYDYNMEFADAFSTKVHCIEVIIFDEEGNYVKSFVEEDNKRISSGDFYLEAELDPGGYFAVAYGGLSCQEASYEKLFEFDDNLKLEDLSVQVMEDCFSDQNRRKLHDHFYGSVTFTVPEEGRVNATIPMMKNTNSVQVALQHVSGEPIDVNDFYFTITDDNNSFNHQNELLETGEITYRPFSKVNRSTGTRDDEENEFHAAVADFTVSRLVGDKATRPMLHIENSEGETVLNLPLVNYMLLFKDINVDGMSDQEYLDRENTWSFVFFLDDRNDTWINTRIIVNDWEVRVDEMEAN